MTAIRIKIAAVVYGILAAAAIAIGFFRGYPDIFHHPDGLVPMSFPLFGRILLGGAAGIAFGLGIARLTRFTVFRFKWARTLHIEFRGLLGPLRGMDILAFAVFSAVAEEMFFRGAIQPELGIVPTSLIFGVLHIAPGRKFLPWPFQAVAMGLAFGGLYWLAGDLSAPIMAHFTINYQNLHFINKYDPSLQLPRSFTSGQTEFGSEGMEKRS
ncbi:MAG: CPBP family intramembrane metalloprotease [Deltaproteobacteria bacterium]|nr:CPBP family intramembrane metalloprotease [Deltaproteobacteria bacterium]